jgi:RelA/SpoT family (p)ppGpp synthetase
MGSPGSAAPAAVVGQARKRDETRATALARLVATVRSRFPQSDVDVVQRAFGFAAQAHQGQTRHSGEPFIYHPLAVAQILADMGMDPDTVAAALLHDTVEDTSVSLEDIAAAFGQDIARLVEGVTKVSGIAARGKAATEAENLRRLILAAVDDLRVILIKLADRLHNMRTVDALTPERRLRMARETLDIYAPLANRLGMWTLKSEFEDLSLRQLEPQWYETIAREVAARRARHEEYLSGVIGQLEERLRAQGIESEITGRAKHYYSIYRKMQRKEIGPDQVYDVLAIRVKVEDIPTCYAALGIVHTLWTPVEGEFDDYIAKRKDNLYQSLHTTVIGPGKRPLEVQIRTFAMDEVAEYGLAAHWKYKEARGDDPEIEEKIAALRRTLKSQSEETEDAEAFVEGLKTDVFRDQVYVFTPNGDVLALPAGSTPIDFAYYIHSEVGHRCRGAYVDGRMVPLDAQLRTGQTVRIVTVKGDAGPSRDWLNPALGYVATTRARSEIKQWFRRQVRATAIAEGREVVERHLRRLGLGRMRQEAVARLFDYDRLDDFLAAVGRHEVPPENITARVLESEAPRSVTQEVRAEPAPHAPAPLADAAGVTTLGTAGVHTRVAGCCRPLPGEDVLGYITRGRGITLHSAECRNIGRLRCKEPDRFVQVRWQATDRQAYPVELRVVAYDRPGLVRDIADIVAQRGFNLASVSATAGGPAGMAMVTAIVEIPSYAQLTSLIDKLATVPNVVDVRRPAR